MAKQTGAKQTGAKQSVEEPVRATPDLAAAVARNLRRLRIQRGYSIVRLARLAEVFPPMLREMEAGKGEPTIGLLWSLATALGVPFAALISGHAARGTVVMRRDKAKVLTSDGGGFTSRALFPFDEGNRIEFYELRMAPHHHKRADPHATGTTETIAVAEGRVEIQVGREVPHVLDASDAILFPADLPHTYTNLGDKPALAYLVMHYADAVIEQAANADASQAGEELALSAKHSRGKL